MINEANNLNQTAIIDCRGPNPGAVPRRLSRIRRCERGSIANMARTPTS